MTGGQGAGDDRGARAAAMTRPGGEAEAFARCIAAGGVAVFPADTVYGLACDPENAAAVERLYALKGRPPDKPAAVMFFARAPALAGLGRRTRGLPGRP